MLSWSTWLLPLPPLVWASSPGRSTKRSAATSSGVGGADEDEGASTPGPQRSDAKLRLWVAVVVTVVWACSFVADVVPSLNYNPAQAIHGAMLVVVGGLFGAELRRRT